MPYAFQVIADTAHSRFASVDIWFLSYQQRRCGCRCRKHLSFHTGMLNGQTALSTGQFPMWVSETEKYVDDGLFFGRYRKGKIKL